MCFRVPVLILLNSPHVCPNLVILSSNLLNEVGSLFSILKYVRYRRKKFTFASSSPDEFLLKGRYCLSFAVGLLFHLFDPQQAKTLTFSSFSANIPGADCRYIPEKTAAYKQAVRETDSDVQPLTYGTGLQTKSVSHISGGPYGTKCHLLLNLLCDLPSMLSAL